MIQNSIIIPLFISFFVSLAIGPFFIKILTRIKAGQTERKEGLESHQKKTGTPVMGGLIFLSSILVVGIIYLNKMPHMASILLVTFAFGLIGFIDDYIKVVLKRSMGLKSWQKMGMQIVVTGVYAYYLYAQDLLAMRIPFSNGKMIDFGVYTIILVFVVILGTVNGSNFTDGVDGLESSVTSAIAVFFIVASVILNAGVEPIAAAVLGGLLGFLVYNLHPAKIFMGDTGSLALGGFAVACAYTLQLPLFIPLFALIYLLEVLSVMIQVGYFKMTHGKRIFRMAPLHHHYEKGGWSETKVVGVFTIVTMLMCSIALWAL